MRPGSGAIARFKFSSAMPRASSSWLNSATASRCLAAAAASSAAAVSGRPLSSSSTHSGGRQSSSRFSSTSSRRLPWPWRRDHMPSPTP